MCTSCFFLYTGTTLLVNLKNTLYGQKIFTAYEKPQQIFAEIKIFHNAEQNFNWNAQRIAYVHKIVQITPKKLECREIQVCSKNYNFLCMNTKKYWQLISLQVVFKFLTWTMNRLQHVHCQIRSLFRGSMCTEFCQHD